MKSSNSITNLINDENFLKPISLNTNISSAELLMMILKYSLRNMLSVTGISDLLKLVNCIFGKIVILESRYKIDQLCKPVNDIVHHGICPSVHSTLVRL